MFLFIKSKCHHPFIINIHGTFQHNRKIYYVLEYCPGGELFGLLRRMTRLTEEGYFYVNEELSFIQHRYFWRWSICMRRTTFIGSIYCYISSLKP